MRSGLGAAQAPLHRLAAAPCDPERRARLFRGEVLLFPAPPDAWSRVLARAAALLADAFAGVPPALAHRLPTDRFVDDALELQARFSADPVVRAAWRETLAGLKVHEPVFADQLFLRVLPPIGVRSSARIVPLHPHRDTWGSQLMAQENWWAPILPVSDRSTLAIWPGCFRRPVPNESPDWSFEEYMRQRRAAGRTGHIAYPSAPRALAAPAVRTALPLRIRPGELAVFSGAHLHGSMPNRSGLTRFSFETRTIVLEEHGALPVGAPNVDGAEGCPRLEWFRDAEGRTLREVLAPGGAGA